MKRRLAYMNPDCFIHVDRTVLPGLAKEFEVLWIPVIGEGYTEFSESEMGEFAARNGIQLKIFHSTQRERSPRNIGLYLSITRFINNASCDLVFSACNNPFWILVSRFLKSPLVFGIHDFQQHSNFNQSRLLHLSTRLAIHLNQYFLFYSESQQALFRREFPTKNSENVGLVSLDYGEPTLSPTSIEDGVKLLFFGRIDHYKGLDSLIQAMESLYADGIENMTLTICGKGDFWSVCEPLIIHKDLFRLYIRFIDNDEIPNLFGTHHFLVLPYKDTTQSGPLMIAIRYGIPVIVPNHEAFLAYCDRTNALVYEQGQLKEALNTCALLSQSDYSRLREQWEQVQDSCTTERIVDKYISYFHEICR